MRRVVLLVCLLSLALPFSTAAESLGDATRAGRVADAQGIVFVRAGHARRWTPVATGFTVQPGDQLRTGVRGANALRLRWLDGSETILGPGSLLEVHDDRALKLVNGEAALLPGSADKVALSGPGQSRLERSERTVVRVEDGSFRVLAEEPLWLQGFTGATANESLGSLVAQVDGRDVPLTIGYHKVTVDIRDQIARTVIEESFVNHTDGRLEGVFYFPLPADASISNFGMWIGGEVVEADVVEKQRARQIYETILREKRDPGLLEWSGGNLFKARVYPIFAHSEKRVTITYTQVLPRQGDAFHYHYALQSELLRQNPLRELDIDVRVHSKLPLTRVACPSHEARIDRTEHSAQVQFSAEEYTPERDFEVVLHSDAGGKPALVVPHRRGENGYFLLLLTPPEGQPTMRPLLPEGEGREFVVIADTSGSLDGSARAHELAFLQSFLNALGPEDRFTLLACDVTCRRRDPAPGDAASVEEALAFVEGIKPAGWTDLEMAFEDAFAVAPEGAHVIYLGDGIPTAGAGDAAATAARFDALRADRDLTVHAVALSTLHEATVLKAMAAIGGGSLRHVRDRNEAPRAAAELLAEILRPALRSITLSFAGVPTARVYPATLPNIPAGRQQIVLGRYLPGEGQEVTVTVRGELDGKKVTWETRLRLPVADAGNAFIPRLWARRHLDVLLEQGRTEAIRDEVVAFSEEYRIMTPYTSFLVLESDADRERFGVKRRFRMRDGEQFFAEGRTQADRELARKQMKRAGTWRIELQQQMVEQVRSLGRNIVLYGAAYGPQGLLQSGFVTAAVGSSQRRSRRQADVGGRFANMDLTVVDEEGEDGRFSENERSKMDRDALEDEQTLLPEAPPEFLPLADEPDMAAAPPAEKLPVTEMPAKDVMKREVVASGEDYKTLSGKAGYRMAAQSQTMIDGMGWGGMGMMGELAGGESVFWDRYGGAGGGGVAMPEPYWFTQLFPYLAPEAVEPAAPGPVEWPEPARKIADKLVQKEAAQRLGKGMRFAQTTHYWYGNRRLESNRYEQSWLISTGRWASRERNALDQPLVRWCDEDRCGVFSEAFLTGRWRDAGKWDGESQRMAPGNFSFHPVYESYSAQYYDIKVVAGSGSTTLQLTNKSQAGYRTEVVIDDVRNVVTEVVQYGPQGLTSRTRFAEYQPVAGGLFPFRTVTENAEGKRVQEGELAIEPLSQKDFQGEWERLLAPWSRVASFQDPLMPLLEAKKQTRTTAAVGPGALLRMITWYAASQQWQRVEPYLASLMETCPRGNIGIRYLSLSIDKLARRHQEARKGYLALAEELTAGQPVAPFAHARYLVQQAQGVLQGNELLALNKTLRPLYDKAPKWFPAVREWQGNQVSFLQQANRNEEAFQLARTVARENPTVYDVQYNYLYQLENRGQLAECRQWIDTLLEKHGPWQPYEEDGLRSRVVQLLSTQGRFPELLEYVERWLENAPGTLSPYQIWLSALVWNAREEEAEALVREWLSGIAELGDDYQQPAFFRAQAAVNFALGQGYQRYTNQPDPRSFPLLAQVARDLAWHSAGQQLLWPILSNYSFRAAQEGEELARDLVRRLEKVAGTLPVNQVAVAIQWLASGALDGRDEAWPKVARVLRTRWRKMTAPNERNLLGQQLLQIYQLTGDASGRLAFAREAWQRADGDEVPGQAALYFEVLLEQPWAKAVEDALFEVLPALGNPKEDEARLAAWIIALRRLGQWREATRLHSLWEAVEKKDQLSRTELRSRYTELRKQAREEGLARFEAARTTLPAALLPWLDLELAYLRIDLREGPGDLWTRGWQRVRELTEQPSDLATPMARFEHLRWLDVLDFLALQEGAPERAVERLVEHCQEQGRSEEEAHPWRLRSFRLLVAADRTEELSRVLATWLQDDRPDYLWLVTAGYLKAETGHFREAANLLEQVAAGDELRPHEWQDLANWYLVLGATEEHLEALRHKWAAQDEYTLSSQLQNELYRMQQDQAAAGEVSDAIAQRFATLFAKAQYPANYTWNLFEFYGHTKDFRLLAPLAEGAVGHTPEQVYPYLQGLVYQFNQMLDEAAADALFAAIAQVRKRARSAVDRRALDLLEAMVARRAATVANAPAEHRDRALKRLRNARKPDLEAGECAWYAEFLANLGALAEAKLKKEQLHQLESLARLTDEPLADQVRTMLALARTYWAYGDRDEAIESLRQFLHVRIPEGPVPPEAAGLFSTLVSYLIESSRLRTAEELLLEALAWKGGTMAARDALLGQLFNLYQRALETDAAVSLGAGQALFENVLKKLHQWVADSAFQNTPQAVRATMYFLEAAHRKGIDAASPALSAFARESLARLRGRQAYEYHSMAGELASALHTVQGARSALAFLLEVLEQEPAHYRHQGQNPMDWHGHNLARWRTEAGPLKELEKRYTAVIVAALRADLEGTTNRGCSSPYHRCSSYFWAAREKLFARTAHEVLREHRDSAPHIEYIAEYFVEGLHRPGDGIDVLKDGWQRKKLSDSGQLRYAELLARHKRYKEAVPVLRSLTKRFPDVLVYRTRLVVALALSKQRKAALRLLDESVAHYRKGGNWPPTAIAQFAQACLEGELYGRAADLFDEAIPLYQRSAANRGIGDGVLSGYYSSLALTRSRLGQTVAAVDAACGAIVSWGASQDNRRGAKYTLLTVLREARDLADYVRDFEAGVDRTGLENPIVRRALGELYLEQRECDKAWRHLGLVKESGSLDEELFNSLLAAARCRKAGADARQVIREWIAFAPRNLDLHTKLADAWLNEGNEAEAERARTGLVEALPEEAASHRKLAEMRMAAKAYKEASVQWEAVVRIRTDEPEGHLGLARALLADKQYLRAGKTLRGMLEARWPERFGNVRYQVEQLLKQLPTQ